MVKTRNQQKVEKDSAPKKPIKRTKKETPNTRTFRSSARLSDKGKKIVVPSKGNNSIKNEIKVPVYKRKESINTSDKNIKKKDVYEFNEVMNESDWELQNKTIVNKVKKALKKKPKSTKIPTKKNKGM